MAIKRPKKGEFAPFHETYLNAAPTGNLLALLRKNLKETQNAFLAFAGGHENFAYAEGKWTVKQLLAHMIDTERVFSFRALWFSKMEKQPMPGFNQDHWMEQTDVSKKSLAELLKELKTVRENSISIFKNMTEAQSKFIGSASGWPVSARTMGWCVLGHCVHHLTILRERYRP